jgi:hypothetical protein
MSLLPRRLSGRVRLPPSRDFQSFSRLRLGGSRAFPVFRNRN